MKKPYGIGIVDSAECLSPAGLANELTMKAGFGTVDAALRCSDGRPYLLASNDGPDNRYAGVAGFPRA